MNAQLQGYTDRTWASWCSDSGSGCPPREKELSLCWNLVLEGLLPRVVPVLAKQEHMFGTFQCCLLDKASHTVIVYLHRIVPTPLNVI